MMSRRSAGKYQAPSWLTKSARLPTRSGPSPARKSRNARMTNEYQPRRIALKRVSRRCVMGFRSTFLLRIGYATAAPIVPMMSRLSQVRSKAMVCSLFVEADTRVDERHADVREDVADEKENRAEKQVRHEHRVVATDERVEAQQTETI